MPKKSPARRRGPADTGPERGNFHVVDWPGRTGAGKRRRLPRGRRAAGARARRVLRPLRREAVTCCMCPRASCSRRRSTWTRWPSPAMPSLCRKLSSGTEGQVPSSFATSRTGTLAYLSGRTSPGIHPPQLAGLSRHGQADCIRPRCVGDAELLRRNPPGAHAGYGRGQC